MCAYLRGLEGEDTLISPQQIFLVGTVNRHLVLEVGDFHCVSRHLFLHFRDNRLPG